MALRPKSSYSKSATMRRERARALREPWLLRLFHLVRLAFWRAFEHDAFAVAKASAFSLIFTLFPLLLVLGTFLAASKHTEVYLREISHSVGNMLPAGGQIALGFLKGSVQRPVRWMVVTSLLTLFTATGVITSWMSGFRAAYGLPKVWGVVKEHLIALLLVVLAGVPLTFATILVVFGNSIEVDILLHTGREFSKYVFALWAMLRWLISIVTSTAVMALIYHHAVPRTQRWHSVLPGAALATVMWFGATALFGWYLRYFVNYSALYGSLGTAMGLLLWLYILSVIVLVGAEFNAMLYPREAS